MMMDDDFEQGPGRNLSPPAYVESFPKDNSYVGIIQVESFTLSHRFESRDVICGIGE